MILCDQVIEWVFALWFSSLIRTLSFGSIAILLFWTIDMRFRSLHPIHRSWLWRALYVKLAFSILCAATLLSLPCVPYLNGLSTVVSTLEPPLQASSNAVQAKNDMNVEVLSTEIGAASPDALWAGVKWHYALLLAWMLGTATCLVYVLFRTIGLIRNIRAATVPVDRENAAIFQTIVSELRIAKPPKLCLVKLDCSPCLIWDKQSTIVLPADFSSRYGREACRIAMAHELGHFVRSDLLWNALASAVTTWLFFFPLAWLMNRRYRIALEMACDAYTIDRAHVDRRRYADLLIGLLDSSNRWPATTSGVAMAGSDSFRSLSTRLNAMKFQKQSHVWLQRSSLIAIGCVAGASLLPWGFAQEDETKPNKKVQSENQITVVGKSIAGGQGTATFTQSSTGSTVVVGSGGGGFTFQSSAGTGTSAGTVASAGTGAPAGGGTSASAGIASDKVSSIGSISKRDENISITTNNSNGKKSMSVEVTSKDRTIKIREEGNTSFKVDIEARSGNETEQNSYSSTNRKEFEATFPDVYAKIKPYIQNVTMGSPVAPVPPVAPAAPASTLATIPKPTKLKGIPRAGTIAGVPPIPAVPGVAVAAGTPLPPLAPLAPIAPIAPVAPKAPSIKGVLEALDKIQVESAGNAEIERLIESIKAKLEDGQE